jgi:hypothetical protein
MTEREMMECLIETSKKEGAVLAAFEALGRTIVELRENLQSRERDIQELKEELAKVKGGRNEW